MKNSINSIRKHIEQLSEAVIEDYYRLKYQIFFKGTQSVIDDTCSGVKGRLATLLYTLGRILGEYKGRYIVKQGKVKE